MGKGTNTVTQNSQPPAAVLQNYTNLTNQANNLAQQPLQQYSGPLVAGFTPFQQEAFNTIEHSQNISAPYINAAAQLASSASAPINPMPVGTADINKYLSPYTQDVVNATQDEFNNQNAIQNQSVVGNAIQNGAWGGDRSAVAQGILANQQKLAQSPVIAGLYNTGFNTALGEANVQQQANIGAQEASGWLGENAGFALGNLGQEAQSTALTGASSLLSAGGLQQALEQEKLNIPYEQFAQGQAYPWQVLGQAANIAEGLGGASGGTSSTTSPGPSVLGQVAGAGLTGLGILGDLGVFARDGGRIRGYDSGGNISLPSIPDLSLSYIGHPIALSGRGVSIPNAPQAIQPPSPLKDALSSIGQADKIKGLFKNNSAITNVPPDVANAAGIAAIQAGQTGAPIDPASTSPWGGEGARDGYHMGGALHRAAGGASGPVGVSGYTFSPGRNIAIPVLNTGAPLSSLGADGNVNTASISNFSPPIPAGQPGSPISAPFVIPNILNTSSAFPISNFTSATQAQNQQQALINGESANTGGGGGLARGGAIEHYDAGGSIEQAGAVGAGQPIGGGNPTIGNLYSQFSQLSPEKLQELSVRYPGNSSQGQLIQRALQAKRMNSTVPPTNAPTLPQSAALSPLPPATPRAPDLGGQSPAPGALSTRYARGGYIERYDDGGDVTNQAPLSPLPNLDIAERPDPKAAVPPQGAISSPPNLSGDQPSELNPSGGVGITSAPAQSPTKPNTKFGSSPWATLTAAGLGMLASRSPFPGIAIGEGGLSALKYLEGQQDRETKQQQIADEKEWRQSEIESKKKGWQLESDKLAATIKQHQDQLAEEKRFHDLAQGAGTWGPGIGTDPTDPTKQVPGSYFYPKQAPGDGVKPPIFFPGVTQTSKAPPDASLSLPAAAQGKTGDDLLKALSPGDAAIVKAYSEGRAPVPTGAALRSPEVKRQLELTSLYDPTFDAVNYPKRAATAKDFSSGQSARNVTSLNTLMGHVEALKKAGDALNNGDFPQVNKFLNWIEPEIGVQSVQASTSAFQKAQNAVADELERVFRGTSGSLEGVRGWKEGLSTSMTPTQQKASIDQLLNLVDSRISALGEQYSRGMGKDTNGLTLLSPEARAAYERVTGHAPESKTYDQTGKTIPDKQQSAAALPPVEGRVAGKTEVMIGDKPYVWSGTGWRPKSNVP